ncbi:MAG: DegT/DnrJ/EryC1/StrS family aminotransferase [Bryobacteraceae bacterium]
MTQPTRRTFLGGAAAGASLRATASGVNGKPALLGGAPVRTSPWPAWPQIGRIDEETWTEALRSLRRNLGRGKQLDRFQETYARLAGARHCLATANGTSSILTALAVLGIGPGDEVIVPAYTFIATINPVLMHRALPVLVDSDPETFQIDAGKIEAAITDRTAAILPVHIGGAAADLDRIMEIGKRRRIPVIEDACQAHLGEWRGRKVGTFGSMGCFSFQASKNLNSAEGGAIVTNDQELFERCYTFHNNGRNRTVTDSYNFSYQSAGTNARMTEFQATLLLAQMTRLEEQSRKRDENGQYLTGMLRQIDGIAPARLHPGCTRNAWHLYMLRYRKEHFAGLSRAAFLKALNAEGIPASRGYPRMNQQPFLKNALHSKGFKAIYSAERLARWEERNQCPANDGVADENVWFTQTMLLDTRQGMEQIAEAIRKIQVNAALLLKA